MSDRMPAIRMIQLINGDTLIAKHRTNNPNNYLGEVAVLDHPMILGKIKFGGPDGDRFEYEMRFLNNPITDDTTLLMPIRSILYWQTPNASLTRQYETHIAGAV